MFMVFDGRSMCLAASVLKTVTWLVVLDEFGLVFSFFSYNWGGFACGASLSGKTFVFCVKFRHCGFFSMKWSRGAVPNSLKKYPMITIIAIYKNIAIVTWMEHTKSISVLCK
jgi:hypothetical protein